MTTLSRELRKQLENTIVKARRVGEEGARKALEQLAVHNHEAWPSMTAEQRSLRNRLRAHGRQLGDKLDEKRGTQTIDRLAQECSYEHWHRMLFARFLAENDLLIEPETGVPISLAECQELAREKNTDWLLLASQYAVRMLPQIFRAGDPVLEINLSPEIRQSLQGLLESLPGDVFVADDSLGWVYQFWQTERKEEVNRSEKKIGADELAAVTQLFTEDYMVLFLLHNTLGAWWAGKVLAAKPEIASQAKDEDDVRAACSVGGYEWTYLRFVREGARGPWRPAAGTFDGWRRAARDLKVLDPCEGSGHFLVFVLPILVAFRIEEESLSRDQAVDAVLRDNLFGLELDNRCTQIAAFNLALAAWKMVGYRLLPQLNIACSGLGINAKEEDWLKLAGKDERVRETMRRLYHLFQQAPVLGSLIDPKRVGGTLFVAEFEKAWPLLEKALAAEQVDEASTELAVTAQGLVQAVRILASEFTLVTTNVPYLGRPNQGDDLKQYCDRYYTTAKSDLATCFLERCLTYCPDAGTASVVITQSWLSQPRYAELRKRLLGSGQFEFLGKLGPRAFEAISGEQVNVCLLVYTKVPPKLGDLFLGVDVTNEKTAADKRAAVLTNPLARVEQARQLKNPDSRITLEALEGDRILAKHASCIQGLATSDDPQFTCLFWEMPTVTGGWEGLLGTVEETKLYGGRERLIHWEDGRGRYFEHAKALKAEGRLGGWKSGTEARGKTGVLVSQMSTMPVTVYTGEFYDHNASVLIVNDPEKLPAVWLFAASGDFAEQVRRLDHSLKPSNNVFVKVPFDLPHWQAAAEEKYPRGLPKPQSDDPTQWLFNGDPKASDRPLQAAVVRLLGYRWPRQTGSSFMDCATLRPDGLEKHADADGIVCLNPVKGQPAADRLRALLSDAFGKDWSGAKQAELLSQVGYGGQSLEDWLRDGFFEQHCELFHQRPFIWHIWDGLKDGFHALMNYHKLAAPNGEGKLALEKLIYTYLGDWITKQRDEVKKVVEGSDARLAAAVHLKEELEKILEGEKPYDIFVRWKRLREQLVGWEPDLNDGVRINIRPFMTASPLNGRGRKSCILRVTPNIKWEKDRGKEPHRAKEDYPWFWKWDGSTDDFAGGKEFDGNRWNDLHYSLAFKQAARQRARKAAR